MSLLPWITLALCMPACRPAESNEAREVESVRGSAIVDSKPASAPKAGVRTVRLQPTVVVDRTGFDKPLAAATLFVPQGWTTEGGVIWGAELACTNGYAFQWTARSPNGRSQISILPQEKWEWNNYGAGATTPGCALAQISDVKRYLETLLARVQPGARVQSCVPRDDLRRQFAQYESATPSAMGEMRTWVEAAELRFHAQDEREGTLAAVVVFSLMRSNTGMGGTMDALTGSTFPAYATLAPKGEHDPALTEAIRRSIQVDPSWEKRISGHNQAIARVALEEGKKRAAMIAQSNEEIAKIRASAWESYSVSADRRARDFADALRGVTTYRDAEAPGGTAVLSSSFDHAWRLADGSYMLSNDAGFDPWRDLKLEGKKLEVGR